MRYRPIPLIQRLTQQFLEEPELALKARNQIMSDFFKSDGFQVFADLLRKLETRAQDTLSKTTDGAAAQRLLGGLNIIESIRSSLVAMLPQREPTPEFYDEASEDYLNPVLEDERGA